jgi:hypothetical protein
MEEIIEMTELDPFWTLETGSPFPSRSQRPPIPGKSIRFKVNLPKDKERTHAPYMPE